VKLYKSNGDFAVGLSEIGMVYRTKFISTACVRTIFDVGYECYRVLQ
jgi:hypothetical protein